MNIYEIVLLVSQVANLMQWLRGRGLLTTNRSCAHCAGANWQDRNTRIHYSCSVVRDDSKCDGGMYRCKHCRKKSAIRKGSFFSNSKLRLRDIVMIIYFEVKMNMLSIGNDIS